MSRPIPEREPVSVSGASPTPPATPGSDNESASTDRPRVDPTAAQIASLWREQLATRSKGSRDGLVLHYVPLVQACANRMASGLPSHVELTDLAQSGVFGLVDAIERFDPERGVRFEAYAVARIRGAILDELRSQDWVPRTVRGRARELERTQEHLESRLRRGVTDREIAAELGLSMAELRAAVRRFRILSVEALEEGPAGRGAVSETLADEALPDPMDVVAHRETARQLCDAVGGLGERDRAVVRMYYLENRTLAEIGGRLGVTESRVCQLHTRLVRRLRGRLEELAVG